MDAGERRAVLLETTLDRDQLRGHTDLAVLEFADLGEDLVAAGPVLTVGLGRCLLGHLVGVDARLADDAVGLGAGLASLLLGGGASIGHELLGFLAGVGDGGVGGALRHHQRARRLHRLFFVRHRCRCRRRGTTGLGCVAQLGLGALGAGDGVT